MASSSNDPHRQSSSSSTSPPHVVEDEPYDVTECVWDHRRPFWHHAAAGSTAGVMEHVFIYPLDNIKTNLQVDRLGQRISFLEVYRALKVRGIVEGFFRGCSSIAGACIPAHIGLFGVYEITKYKFITGSSVPLSEAQLVQRGALCGAAGQLAHDLVLTPFDVIKQRIQLGCYKSVRTAITGLLKEEGPQSFYRSFPVTLAMNMPYGSIMIATNEFGKRKLGIEHLREADEVKDQLGWFFLSAGFAGSFAALCTQPLDVTKTRLQTQTCLQTCDIERCATIAVTPKYRGFIDTVGTIWRSEGFVAFFRGSSARAIISFPAAAISWGTYEIVKSLL